MGSGVKIPAVAMPAAGSESNAKPHVKADVPAIRVPAATGSGGGSSTQEAKELEGTEENADLAIRGSIEHRGAGPAALPPAKMSW
jgi:hypothetical protein